MRTYLSPSAVLMGLAYFAAAAQQQAEVTQLSRTELEKLAGTWELKVDTKDGWKGVVRANIVLYARGSAQERFGSITYDVDVSHPDDQQLQAKNARGPQFTAVRYGDKLLLVTSKERAPFKIQPTDETTAPLTLADDQLTLDVSKSSGRFCGPFSGLDLDWAELRFVKPEK